MRVSKQRIPIKVLHVDDDTCFLEVSKQILTLDNNFEIDNVSSVDEAMNKMENQSYDAVLSDYEMPQKSGLYFLRELKEKNNEIPFILFTGRGREEVVVKALNLGADRYINKNGAPELVYCELADAINKTVERKTSKRLLSESEMKYRSLVDNSLQGILVTIGSPLKLVFANEAMGKMLGYSVQELMFLSPKEIKGLIFIQDREIFFKLMENRLLGNPAESCYEFRAVKKDESIIWLRAIANRIEFNGQFAVQGMFLDITEVKQNEEDVHSLAKFPSENPNPVLRIGQDGRVLYVNASAQSQLREFKIKKGQYAPDKLSKLAAEVLSSSLEKSIELQHGNKQFIFSMAPITDANYVNVYGFDITERKKIDDKLRKSEERFRELANSLPDIVFETDNNGTLLYVNDRAFEIAGYSTEDFKKGLTVMQFLVPEEQQRATENIKRLLEGGKYFPDEYKFVRKNGTSFPALITAMPRICNNKVEGLRGFILDISERKKEEDELEKSRNHFRNLVDSVLSGIIVVDGETREILDANPAALGFMGAKREDVLGKRCHQFICPNEIGNCPIMDKGQIVDKAERVLLTKEGKRLPVIKSVVKVEQNGKTLLVENYVDISDRKKAELSLEENRRRLQLMNEKLNVVGALTRHDVRNKLSAVNGYAYLLKKKHADQMDIVEALSKMEQAVKDSMKIFDFAKLYEQIGLEQLTYIDSEKALAEAVALFSGPMPTIINDCKGLTVLADSFLRQLFYNFINNTVKHGQKTTTIRIYYQKTDGDCLKLIYEDDGVGVPSENKSKLFKEGFSTGGGTGFGLFLIRKMIDVYGWSIVEDGIPGKGVKFELSIPIHLVKL